MSNKPDQGTRDVNTCDRCGKEPTIESDCENPLQRMGETSQPPEKWHRIQCNCGCNTAARPTIESAMRAWNEEHNGATDFKWSLSLDGTCPKCKEDIDIVAEVDCWYEQFEFPDRVRNDEMCCPKCGEEISINIEY